MDCKVFIICYGRTIQGRNWWTSDPTCPQAKLLDIESNVSPGETVGHWIQRVPRRNCWTLDPTCPQAELLDIGSNVSPCETVGHWIQRVPRRNCWTSDPTCPQAKLLDIRSNVSQAKLLDIRSNVSPGVTPASKCPRSKRPKLAVLLFKTVSV